MKNDVAEYGILVTVRSAKDTYLFLDGTDRARYMAIFIKMLGRNAIGDARPLIAGLNSDTAQILFQNGYEEPLRLLVRMMHASYASYRKAKNCPVQLARSAFDLIDGKKEVAGAVKSIRDKSDFICTIFDREGEHCPPPGTLAERIKTIPGKISGTLLLELAAAYKELPSKSCCGTPRGTAAGADSNLPQAIRAVVPGNRQTSELQLHDGTPNFE